MRFMQLGTLARRLSFSHDVKQRSGSSFPRRVAAPGFCPCDRVHPPGGVGGAPTGAHILLSRLRDATDPRW